MSGDDWSDFFEEDEPSAPPPKPLSATSASTVADNVINISANSAYVNAAIDSETAALAAMGKDSGRNSELNNAALKLGTLPGVDREAIRRRLLDACATNGLLAEDGEKACTATIESGFAKADKDGPRVIESRQVRFSVTEVSDEELLEKKGILEELEQDFWTSRDYLKLIFQAALSRMASPWAVLACCAARLICVVPPAITLPPIVGGAGSLNWFAAISAKSGGGKGAAMAVATKLVEAPDIVVRGIGSGEGMIEAYQRSEKMKDAPDPVVAVLFSIDEIDSLGAMGGRSGQTTMSIIRSGFSGETLGFSYRGRQAETVASHTYRMAIVASVQPERAGVLFDDAGGGTPQRFLWFPGRDWRITAYPPQWPTDSLGREKVIKRISVNDLANSVGVLKIPALVIQELREARAASNRGDDNALDSHALFCREKFAFILALMDGRTEINDEDWRLATIAAAVSDWIRTKTQEGYLEGKRNQSRERGGLRAIEDDERQLVESSTYSLHVHRIGQWIRKTLDAHGPLTTSGLSRKAASRDRPRLLPALATAKEQGHIADVDGKWVLT